MLIVVLLYWALEYQATAYRYGLLNCFDFGCLRSLATGRIRSGPVPRNRTGPNRGIITAESITASNGKKFACDVTYRQNMYLTRGSVGA